MYSRLGAVGTVHVRPALGTEGLASAGMAMSFEISCMLVVTRVVGREVGEWTPRPRRALGRRPGAGAAHGMHVVCK